MLGPVIIMTLSPSPWKHKTVVKYIVLHMALLQESLGGVCAYVLRGIKDKSSGLNILFLGEQFPSFLEFIAFTFQDIMKSQMDKFS